MNPREANDFDEDATLGMWAHECELEWWWQEDQDEAFINLHSGDDHAESE